MDLSEFEKEVLLRAFRLVCVKDSSVFIEIKDFRKELDTVNVLIDKIMVPRIVNILEKYRRMVEGFVEINVILNVARSLKKNGK